MKHEKCDEIRYYREWMSQCGWGVMIEYDTVMAKDRWKATESKPFGMYACDKSFECIIEVDEKHLHLNDEKLSKIYGESE